MRTAIHKKSVHALASAGFQICRYDNFDYDLLKFIMVRKRSGMSKKTYGDVIMMADTETSKKMVHPGEAEEDHHNHVCAWSLAIRAYHMNICVLWGKKPSELADCLERIRDQIISDEIYLYWHNMPYDWIFTRKFLMKQFGEPTKQLNVKPLYPLQIRFSNGLIMKDSLMLAQRSLEKWGKDLHVEHGKAVGKWDYDAIRDQETWVPDEDQLEYICDDVLCGVECIDKTCEALNKTIGSLPLTATGIVRGEARLAGKKEKAYEWATSILPDTYEEMLIQEEVFHGGYTHGNRFSNNEVYPCRLDTGNIIQCFDIASSYPFVMLVEKFPCERFWMPKQREWKADYILRNMEDFAFMFKITIKGLKLRDPRHPMPAISHSKCEVDINSVVDNGRIIAADYIEMRTNEIDFALVYDIYDLNDENLKITELQCAAKDYLPKWLRDYVYHRFVLKTQLKGVDPVLYAIEKAKLNSIFGMSAQKTVKMDIIENYETGEFAPPEFETDAQEYEFLEKEYAKYLKNRNTFLPYCIGIWVTSHGMNNLFRLGSCVAPGEVWLYSDTDSVYATGFDERAIKAYNENCKRKLKTAGYGAVHWNNKDFYLGVAEDDGKYMQFKALHAKCYCKRPIHFDEDNNVYAINDGANGFFMGDALKITVAGVPKKGAKSLNNNIDLFKVGFIFPGSDSGKLQHTHYFVDDIYIDEAGNEVGDSIELSDCDYMIKDQNDIDFDDLLEEEVQVIDYEKEYTE